MSVTHLLPALLGGPGPLGGSGPVGGSGSVMSIAVDVLAAEEVVYGVTAARIWGSVAALLAVASVVVGGLALARSVRGVGNRGRNGGLVALVAGLVAGINGVANLAVADGGPGTGNGVVAGAAALVLGVVAVVLGGVTLARSRRTG